MKFYASYKRRPGPPRQLWTKSRTKASTKKPKPYLHTINNILPLSPEVIGILLGVQKAVFSGHPGAVVSPEEAHVHQTSAVYWHAFRRPVWET